MGVLKSVSLITQDARMLDLIERINRIADSDISVLLIGETGVGKEVFTDYIHHLSKRGPYPLVKIGLATLPPDLLESELFGFEKGSFTNADHSKKGMFEIAHLGTLFLDDIDDSPLNVQSKLLRAIEAEEIRHIGGTSAIPINVRLVCASKMEVKDLVDNKLFRQDLYYRINVVELRIPPLRERRNDIPLLAKHFLKRYKPKEKLFISDEVMSIFMSYDWPGNVRELRNVVQRSSLFAEGVIKVKDLPDRFKYNNRIEKIVQACKICFDSNGMSYGDLIKCIEVRLLSEAMSKTNGNQSNAAKNLGMKLSTFRDKIKKLEIN
ncbi:MAG: sigma-54-dependent Fis family transcriptional regulator [Chlorobi bacterium]|nr:sigma-54-dependent Fis family transcriptional regulator [Chlorobiota bacterium]